MPLITTARSTLTVVSRPANRSFSASSRWSFGWAAAKLSMVAAACSIGTRRLARVGMSFTISALSRHASRSSTGGPSHIWAEVSVGTLCWMHGQSGLGAATLGSAATAAASNMRNIATRPTDGIERNARHSIPSPIMPKACLRHDVGEGQGGGIPERRGFGFPPPLTPPHKGEGNPVAAVVGETSHLLG